MRFWCWIAWGMLVPLHVPLPGQDLDGSAPPACQAIGGSELRGHASSATRLPLRDAGGGRARRAGRPDNRVVPEAIGVLAGGPTARLCVAGAAGDRADAFVRELVAWLEEVDVRILRDGRPLSQDLRSIAAEIGVAHIDSIRALRVEDVPTPVRDSALYAAGVERGLWGPGIRGNAQIFGYGITATDDVLADRGAMAHELMHVRQIERLGGLQAFVAEYLHQIATHGYRDAPLEREAFRMNQRFGGADPGAEAIDPDPRR